MLEVDGAGFEVDERSNRTTRPLYAGHQFPIWFPESTTVDHLSLANSSLKHGQASQTSLQSMSTPVFVVIVRGCLKHVQTS